MIDLFLLGSAFVLTLGLAISCWLVLAQSYAISPFLYQEGVIFTQFTLLASLINRWILSGHFPLSNLFESLIFLAWFVVFGLMILNRVFIALALESPAVPLFYFLQSTGAFVLPFVSFLIGFAAFQLPDELKQATALVPALQSNWLLMHVSVMIAGYGFLMMGCLYAIAFLVFETTNSKDSEPVNLTTPISQSDKMSSQVSTQDKELQGPTTPLTAVYDSMSYRLIGLGFTSLTIGLLSGSIWANQTWGSYWSWDPKETWALITWFIFAIYLHTRLYQGWKGRNSAKLATFGFFIVWLCYLGVNLMGKGLHSYGFAF